MTGVEERFDELQALVAANDANGKARVENEFDICLASYPNRLEKIAALGRLKARLGDWPNNDLAKYLLTRIDDRRELLMK